MNEYAEWERERHLSIFFINENTQRKSDGGMWMLDIMTKSEAQRHEKKRKGAHWQKNAMKEDTKKTYLFNRRKLSII